MSSDESASIYTMIEVVKAASTDTSGRRVHAKGSMNHVILALHSHGEPGDYDTWSEDETFVSSRETVVVKRPPRGILGMIGEWILKCTERAVVVGRGAREESAREQESIRIDSSCDELSSSRHSRGNSTVSNAENSGMTDLPPVGESMMESIPLLAIIGLSHDFDDQLSLSDYASDSNSETDSLIGSQLEQFLMCPSPSTLHSVPSTAGSEKSVHLTKITRAKKVDKEQSRGKQKDITEANQKELTHNISHDSETGETTTSSSGFLGMKRDKGPAEDGVEETEYPTVSSLMKPRLSLKAWAQKLIGRSTRKKKTGNDDFIENPDAAMHYEGTEDSLSQRGMTNKFPPKTIRAVVVHCTKDPHCQGRKFTRASPPIEATFVELSYVGD